MTTEDKVVKAIVSQLVSRERIGGQYIPQSMSQVVYFLRQEGPPDEIVSRLSIMSIVGL